MLQKTTNEAYWGHSFKDSSRWVISCDHASARVPSWVNGGELEVSEADMTRHIAYDIGAEGVAMGLSQALRGAAIFARFSRLVIDPNRSEYDPTLIMQIYDKSLIPANINLTQEKIDERLYKLYFPYHKAYEALASQTKDAVICAIHSFTPQLKGKEVRPWDIGVLFSSQDDRLAQPFIKLCKEQGWCVGVNEPYKGELPGDSVDQHALQKGRANLLIELRQDLIADPHQQMQWAQRLAPLLQRALSMSGL